MSSGANGIQRATQLRRQVVSGFVPMTDEVGIVLRTPTGIGITRLLSGILLILQICFIEAVEKLVALDFTQALPPFLIESVLNLSARLNSTR